MPARSRKAAEHFSIYGEYIWNKPNLIKVETRVTQAISDQSVVIFCPRLLRRRPCHAASPRCACREGSDETTEERNCRDRPRCRFWDVRRGMTSLFCAYVLFAIEVRGTSRCTKGFSRSRNGRCKMSAHLRAERVSPARCTRAQVAVKKILQNRRFKNRSPAWHPAPPTDSRAFK